MTRCLELHGQWLKAVHWGKSMWLVAGPVDQCLCLKATCSVTSVSQCDSEMGLCNRLQKANFNEDLDAETLEIAVMNAVWCLVSNIMFIFRVFVVEQRVVVQCTQTTWLATVAIRSAHGGYSSLNIAESWLKSFWQFSDMVVCSELWHVNLP